jgi:hypothetical protein
MYCGSFARFHLSRTDILFTILPDTEVKLRSNYFPKWQSITLFGTFQLASGSSTSTMSDANKLPQETVEILQPHLPEFRDAQAKRRKAIITATSDQTVAPGSSKALAKRHKKVSESQLTRLSTCYNIL